MLLCDCNRRRKYVIVGLFLCLFTSILAIYIVVSFEYVVTLVKVKIQKVVEGNIPAVLWELNDIYIDRLLSVVIKEIQHPYVPPYSSDSLSNRIKKGFFYDTALGADAIWMLYVQNRDPRLLALLESFYSRLIGADGCGIIIDDHFSVDTIMHGSVLMSLYEETNNIKYKRAVDMLFSYLVAYYNESGNSIPYRKSLHRPLFLVDTLAMVSPFLLRYGNLFKNETARFMGEEMIHDFLRYGIETQTGLPFHGYLRHGHKIGIVGWGRGVGWYLLGLVRSLKYISKEDALYKDISLAIRNCFDTLAQAQNTDGGWGWYISHYNSDSSATALIAYMMLESIKAGYISVSFLDLVEKAHEYIRKNTTSLGYVLASSGDCNDVGRYSDYRGHMLFAQAPALAFSVLLYNDHLSKEISYP